MTKDSIALTTIGPDSQGYPAGIIQVSGQDAKTFLQGQLTVNMDTLTQNQPCFAAHCHPNGRVISLFHIALHDDSYFLIMPVEMTGITIHALSKYARFYPVTLQERQALPFPYQLRSHHERIMTLQPAIYPETSGVFLPHELNLPEWLAVDFNKGCYTGQEIIARMHYRGKLKKHLYLTSINRLSPPKPGTEVLTGNHDDARAVAIVVDSLVTKDNDCFILILCEDAHATDNHVYLGDDPVNMLTFSAHGGAT